MEEEQPQQQQNPRLDTIPDVCRLHIFQYLVGIDLGEVSCTCKVFQQDCRNPSLPQDRTIVVRFRKPTDGQRPFNDLAKLVTKLDTTIINRSMMQLSTITPQHHQQQQENKINKFKTMKLIYAEKNTLFGSNNAVPRSSRYPTITCLDMSSSSSDSSGGSDSDDNPQAPQVVTFNLLTIYYLLEMLPNLVTIDMSNIVLPSKDSEFTLPQSSNGNCVNVRSLTWKNLRNNHLNVDGTFLNCFHHLSELYLDNSVLAFTNHHVELFEEDPNDEYGMYLFYRYNVRLRLTKVSIPNVKLCTNPNSGSKVPNYVPITASMILKFIKNTPTLTWLRSDLSTLLSSNSSSSITQLQQERPNLILL